MKGDEIYSLAKFNNTKVLYEIFMKEWNTVTKKIRKRAAKAGKDLSKIKIVAEKH